MKTCVTFWYITLAIIVSGCSSMMGGMTPEQINAAVKDKSSAVACSDFTGAGGKFSVIYVNNDKTFGTAGGKTTVKCAGGEVSFEDSGKAIVIPAPAVVPK